MGMRRRVLRGGVFVGLLLMLAISAASGASQSAAIEAAIASGDKQDTMRAFTLANEELNAVVGEFMQQATALQAHVDRLLSREAEKIKGGQPMIWETDAQFEARVEEELSALSHRMDEELGRAISAILPPYQSRYDLWSEYREKANDNLGKSTVIHPTTIAYGEYLRNEQLWPVSLTLEDTLLEPTSVTLAVDLAGEGLDTQQIRTAIIEFAEAVSAQTLQWKASYHVVVHTAETDDGTDEVVRYLLVLDEVAVLDQVATLLYQSFLDTPILLASFDPAGQLSSDEPVHGIWKRTYEGLSTWEETLRNKDLPILLSQAGRPPATVGYEEERLAVLASKQPTAVPKKDVVFRIANGAEPQSLDPALIQGVPEHRVCVALFEGLVTYDPETSTAVPGVAESWISNRDGTQYTFTLRKNAVWSDGTPITAHDVVYSWLRILNPRTGAPYAWFPAMFLVGAEEYNAGRGRAEGVGIRALDNYTFQMDLIGPLPYAVDALAHYSFAIVPKHTIEKYGSRWTDPANFVSNGPFVLSEHLPYNSITVTRSPTYWDRDAVNLTKVIFYNSDSTTNDYYRYLNGEIDWTTNVQSDEISTTRRRDDYHVFPQLATYYYVFQTEKAPINNPLVRQALALAIDRTKLVDSYLRAGQIPAWGIVPPMAGYDGLTFPFTSMGEAIGKARSLLAQAGYPDGRGFPSLSILYNSDSGNQQIAQFIQQEWKKNLGITVVLQSQEWSAYLSNRNRGNFLIARAGWIGDYQDPNTFLDMFITGAGMNGGKYSNEVYDLLINEAARMRAGADRFAVLTTAEEILINQDQAVLPLYYYVNYGMIDLDKWGGWYTNTMDIHPLKDIYLR